MQAEHQSSLSNAKSQHMKASEEAMHCSVSLPNVPLQSGFRIVQAYILEAHEATATDSSSKCYQPTHQLELLKATSTHQQLVLCTFLAASAQTLLQY
jgi:hypothetical protein